MKIAVSSEGGALGAKVAENFGRCAYFIVVDSETMKFEPLPNPAAVMMGGAGPAAASAINQCGCNVVLTGIIGPRASDALEAHGIRAVAGVSGTVREAVEKYLKENA